MAHMYGEESLVGSASFSGSAEYAAGDVWSILTNAGRQSAIPRVFGGADEFSRGFARIGKDVQRITNVFSLILRSSNQFHATRRWRRHLAAER